MASHRWQLSPDHRLLLRKSLLPFARSGQADRKCMRSGRQEVSRLPEAPSGIHDLHEQAYEPAWGDEQVEILAHALFSLSGQTIDTLSRLHATKP